MPYHPYSGLDHVILVATKAKGLPRISISLHRVTGSVVNDVIANFSVALYAAYRTTQEHVSRGCCHLLVLFIYRIQCLYLLLNE